MIKQDCLRLARSRNSPLRFGISFPQLIHAVKILQSHRFQLLTFLQEECCINYCISLLLQDMPHGHLALASPVYWS